MKKKTVQETGNSDFFEALALLEKERGLPANYLMEKIKNAIVIAAKRDYGSGDNVIVDIDPATDTFKVTVIKQVVETVENPSTEITLGEARAYLADPVLRDRLLEISGALLELDSSDPGRVMGYPDDLKLRSCMTLFSVADPDCPVFQAVLDKFFRGQPDTQTLAMLGETL